METDTNNQDAYKHKHPLGDMAALLSLVSFRKLENAIGDWVQLVDKNHYCPSRLEPGQTFFP